MSSLGALTSADEILAGRDLAGTNAIVTGATGGIGLETARALAAHGACVTLAARDRARLESCAAGIRASTGNPTVDVLELDLAALAKVRAAAADWAARGRPLHLLINNAGVMASPLMHTDDGHELQFGVCHLGHFLFTCLLAPQLLAGAPARVVNVSSAGHKFSPVHCDDPDFHRRPYDKWMAYGQAKTANILFSVALSARLGARGVQSNAVHPGAIGNTDLGRHLTPEDRAHIVSLGGVQAKMIWKTPGQGAATQVWAGVAPELAGRGGLYLEDCGVAEPNDHSVGAQAGYRSFATDPAGADALWELSERLVGERFAWDEHA